MFASKLLGALGVILILFVCWLISENRRAFPFRIVIFGLALQFAAATFILYVPAGVGIFQWIGDKVTTFLNYGYKSADFLFGNLLNPGFSGTFGFQFAAIVLVTIVFFSSFISILYHYGIMQRIVYAMAWVMEKTMGTSGVESLNASANVFLGQTEAPLLIRKYLPYASRSEVCAVMVGGFCTIAGGVMAAYISMGISAETLIAASVIAAPTGLMLSKIAVPPTATDTTTEEIKHIDLPRADNVLVAITDGAADGLKLVLNIIAMLIAFISLIALLDAGFRSLDAWLTPIGFPWLPSSLAELLGYIFQPFAYIANIPANEARTFGALVGQKIALNEFVAYADLAKMIQSGAISERTARIATFALCGFANFSSIAIQIGGLGAMVPDKKTEIAQLGLKAMTIGALANLMTAVIAGLYL
ncbi:MAG: NupC/NupG family nucleoside CNT transporter [Chloroflexota bacterium]